MPRGGIRITNSSPSVRKISSSGMESARDFARNRTKS
jgi:hypothetical protein